MAYEDFTTYTEVDPNSQIGLVGTDHLDVSLHRNADAYLYDDKGAGYFGDYEHLIDFKFISHTNNGTYAIDLCTNVIDDAAWIYGNADGLGVRTSYSTTPGYCFYLTDFGLLNNDLDNIVITNNVWYYLTIKRLGTTATCKIYSDKARTTLIDTMTVTCKTTTYRYIYAVDSWNSGNADVLVSDIEDLDFQIETHILSDTAKASDSVDYIYPECDISCQAFSIIGTINTVALYKPVWGGEGYMLHKDLQAFNFWSGNFSIHDKGIDSEPIILSGVEIGSGICGCNHACFTAKFVNMRTMANNNEEIEISGLGDCVDAIYVIKSLSTKTMHKRDARIWTLTLEYVRDA